MIETKKCSDCGESKTVLGFYPCNNGGRLGTKSECKHCHSIRAKTVEHKVFTKVKRYNLTLLEFLILGEYSNWECNICLDPITLTGCHVDHNHKTNKVRGLLCKRCNMGIGYMKDNLFILSKAIQYLMEGDLE